MKKITSKTAKLAKEKGLDQSQFERKGLLYDENGNETGWEMLYNYSKNHFGILNQSELQTWLRNKGVMVEVTFYTCDDGVEYSVEVCHEKTWDTKSEFTKDTFKSYEKAIERGLQEGLKLL